MKHNATLLRGRDILMYENGFIISEEYQKDKVIGRISHIDYASVVEELLTLFNKCYCDKTTIYPIYITDILSMINKFIIWL